MPECLAVEARDYREQRSIIRDCVPYTTNVLYMSYFHRFNNIYGS